MADAFHLFNIFLSYISIAPENIRKPQGFPIFPYGIEMEHWNQMG